MKRYIVCVPQQWESRIVAIPYSVMAETPIQAARDVWNDPNHHHFKVDCIGEICVIEAKAGRLDDWRNFYSLSKFTLTAVNE